MGHGHAHGHHHHGHAHGHEHGDEHGDEHGHDHGDEHGDVAAALPAAFDTSVPDEALPPRAAVAPLPPLRGTGTDTVLHGPLKPRPHPARGAGNRATSPHRPAPPFRTSPDES